MFFLIISEFLGSIYIYIYIWFIMVLCSNFLGLFEFLGIFFFRLAASALRGVTACVADPGAEPRAEPTEPEWSVEAEWMRRREPWLLKPQLSLFVVFFSKFIVFFYVFLLGFFIGFYWCCVVLFVLTFLKCQNMPKQCCCLCLCWFCGTFMEIFGPHTKDYKHPKDLVQTFSTVDFDWKKSPEVVNLLRMVLDFLTCLAVSPSPSP